MKVAVFGATGKTGRYLVRALVAAGHTVFAFGRDAQRLAAICPDAVPRVADLDEAAKLDLSDAEAVVSLAHGRFVPAILPAVPAACGRIVFTGSTRIFSALDDPAADAVRRGLAVLRSCDRPAWILHPSMIFGAPEDRNVNRILAFIARWPRRMPLCLPLPNGGRHLVQPIYYKDVVAAVAAALETPPDGVEEIVLAGPEPIRYRDLVAALANELNRRATIWTVPSSVLAGAMALAGKLGIVPPVDAAGIRRATEDKSFDVAPMRDRLGVEPTPLAAALANMRAERGGSLVPSSLSRDDDG